MASGACMAVPRFVGRFPLGEERAIIEAQMGGLLGDTDVASRSGE